MGDFGRYGENGRFWKFEKLGKNGRFGDNWRFYSKILELAPSKPN